MLKRRFDGNTHIGGGMNKKVVLNGLKTGYIKNRDFFIYIWGGYIIE